MRTYSIAIAAFTGLISGLTLLLGLTYPSTASLEQAACSAGICATERVAAGTYEKFLAAGPATGVIDSFRALVIRNPGSPYTWAMLAEALAETGDNAAAKDAMVEAIARGSTIPQIHIRAANLFALAGDAAAAGRSLAVVLRTTSTCDQVVFDSFRRWGLPVSSVVPLLAGDTRALRAYFDDLRRNGSPSILALRRERR